MHHCTIAPLHHCTEEEKKRGVQFLCSGFLCRVVSQPTIVISARTYALANTSFLTAFLFRLFSQNPKLFCVASRFTLDPFSGYSNVIVVTRLRSSLSVRGCLFTLYILCSFRLPEPALAFSCRQNLGGWGLKWGSKDVETMPYHRPHFSRVG